MKKLLMALALLPLMAAAETITYLTEQNYQDGGVILTGVESGTLSGALDIPSTYNGQTVTGIGGKIFEAKYVPSAVRIESVSIPASVKTIGKKAFCGCTSLKQVILNEGLRTIGKGAFEGCPIDEVVIPASVMEIEDNVFGMEINGGKSMIGVAKISVMPGNPRFKITSDGLLYDFVDKKVLAAAKGVTRAVIPGDCEIIGESALGDQLNLAEVVFPRSLRRIECKAFSWTALKAVDLSDTQLEFLGCEVFWTCRNLTSVKLPITLGTIGCYHSDDPPFGMNPNAAAVGWRMPTLTISFAGRIPELICDFCNPADAAKIRILVQPEMGWENEVRMGKWQGCSIRYAGTSPLDGPFELLPGEAVSLHTGLIGYTVKGLPGGLKYDKKTGRITGAAKKPTAAEGVTVKFTKKGDAAAEMTIVVEKEKMSVGCAGLEDGVFMVGVAGGAGIPLEIETQSGVKSVKVSKLPAGMKYNAKTGLIEGAPTKAGDFTVQIAVTAKSGAVEKKDIAIRVDPLPDWAVGTFSGMIGRRLESSGEDGAAFYGSLQFTVKATGAVSAKVTAGGKTYSFSAKGFRGVEDGEAFLSRVNYPDADEVACRVSDTLVLDLETKKGDALLLGVTLFQKSGHLCVAKAGGTFVRSGSATPYGLVAWRNEAGKDSRIAPGSPAAEAVARLKNLGKVYLKAREIEPRSDGARHFALDWRGGEPLHRYGSKEADVTLSVDKTGNVKVSGKIDGVKITASTPLRIGGNEWFTVTADSIAYDKKSGMDYAFILGWDTIDPRTGVISVTPDPNADPSTVGPDMHGFELWVEPFE